MEGMYSRVMIALAIILLVLNTIAITASADIRGGVTPPSNQTNSGDDCGLNLFCWLGRFWNWLTGLGAQIVNAIKLALEEAGKLILNAIASALDAVFRPFIEAAAELFLGVAVDPNVYAEMGISIPKEAEPYLYDAGKDFSGLMDDMRNIAAAVIGIAMLIGFLALFMERFLVDPGTGVRIIRRGVLLLIFLPLIKYFYHLAALAIAMLVGYIAPPSITSVFTLPLGALGLILLPLSPILLLMYITIAIIAAVRLLLNIVLAMLLPLLLALELIPFVEGIARRLRDLLVSSMFVVVVGAMCFRAGAVIAGNLAESVKSLDLAGALVNLALILAVFTTPLIIAMLAGPTVRAAGMFLAGAMAGAVAGLSGAIAQRFGRSPLWMARATGAGVRGVARGAGYIAGSLLEMPSRIRRLPSNAVSWARYQARRIGGALKESFMTAHPELHRRYLGYTDRYGHTKVDYYASMAKTALRRGARPEQVRRALEQQTDKLTAYEAWRKALRELEEEEEEQE